MSESTLPSAGDLVWQYRRLWAEGSSPDLASFLAKRSNVPTDVLLDLLDVDQWHRWGAGRRARAEEYLAAYPRLWDDPEHALRVVYGEFLLREQRGEAPEAVDFAARFPALADRLAQQIELHRALGEGGPNVSGGRATIADPGRSPPPVPGAPQVPGFEVLSEVGRGGMGVVYQARQEKLRRTVALKFLSGAGQECPETLLRFRREAESAARLQHPNIVQIFEVGEAGGRPYIVMEFVAGGAWPTGSTARHARPAGARSWLRRSAGRCISPTRGAWCIAT
ncbi:MAG: protein kinase [Gemmataceae bacterium]